MQQKYPDQPFLHNTPSRYTQNAPLEIQNEEQDCAIARLSLNQNLAQTQAFIDEEERKMASFSDFQDL